MTALPFALALCIAGFAALAAAMPRHRRELGIAHAPSAAALRLLAAAILLGALLVCGTIWNPARAVPIMLGLASVAALIVGLIFSFAPRALPWLATALPLLTAGVALWL